METVRSKRSFYKRDGWNHLLVEQPKFTHPLSFGSSSTCSSSTDISRKCWIHRVTQILVSCAFHGFKMNRGEKEKRMMLFTSTECRSESYIVMINQKPNTIYIYLLYVCIMSIHATLRHVKVTLSKLYKKWTRGLLNLIYSQVPPLLFYKV